MLNGECRKQSLASTLGPAVSFGTIGGVTTSVIIISKVLGSATLIPFSGMALMSSQEVISWITQIGAASSVVGRRLLLEESFSRGQKGCLITALVLNYILNGIHIWVVYRYINSDPHFHKNKKKGWCRAADRTLLVLSSLTNFRLYQLVFSKLCNVRLFSSKLSSISQLIPLKILNSLAVVVSVISMAGAGLTIAESSPSSGAFALGVISIVLSALTTIWTLLTFAKDEHLFRE